MFKRSVTFALVALVLTLALGCTPPSPTTSSPYNIAQMSADIAALKNSVTTMQTSLNSISTTGGAKQSDVDALKSQVASLQTAVMAIKVPDTSSYAMKSDVTGLQTLVAKIQTDIGNMKPADLTALNTQLVDLTTKLTALQASVSAINAAMVQPAALTGLDARLKALETKPVTYMPPVSLSGFAPTTAGAIINQAGSYPVIFNLYGADSGADFNVLVNGGTVMYATITADEREIYIPIYAFGKAKVTHGSAIVNGITTNWLGTEGYYFKANSDANYYFIESVNSAIEIVLDEQYEGSTSGTSGVSYGIYAHEQSPNRTATIVVLPNATTAWKVNDVIQISVVGLNISYALVQAGV